MIENKKIRTKGEVVAKSVEQKLWEAYNEGRGAKLSWQDVLSLIKDDAVGARISNQAADDVRLEMPGDNCIGMQK